MCCVPLLGAAVLACLACLACTSEEGSPDAAIDARPLIDAPTGEVQPTLLALDFTVTGCPDLDLKKPQCKGPAPLTISFVPITSGNISRLLWDFNDGQPKSSERIPTHTYVLPGSYSPSVIGVPGSVGQQHPDFIVTTANALGGSCDLDSQCEEGLACLCGAGAKCPAAFARGICSRGCAAAACPTGAVCADLSSGLMGPPAEPWRAPQCLRACEKDGDCAPGHRCRAVPAAGLPERWVRACFVGFPADLGASCRAAGGELQKESCLGGVCSDLGALGVCSLDCRARACPEGTACAAFKDGRRLCLRACGADAPCREDPLLACEAPGRAGPLGFTVAGAPAGGTYCAPKACESDNQCTPAGVCQGDVEGTHCVLRSAARP
jgi:hypothetical protein